MSRINLRSGRRLRVACAGLVLIAAGVSLSACSELPEEASYLEAPASLEPIEGTEVKRVKFSEEGAKRVGLRTVAVRGDDRQKTIPYAAVIYAPEGATFTYTNPEPLTYVRREIEIDRVEGDRVVLSGGPPAGTEVVTVGAAEVYGTEFEVDH